jgi:hypothetical protein
LGSKCLRSTGRKSHVHEKYKLENEVTKEQNFNEEDPVDRTEGDIPFKGIGNDLVGKLAKRLA